MPELKELHESIMSLHSEFKKTNDARKENDSLTEEKLEKLNTAMDEVQKKIDDKIKEIETKLNRPEVLVEQKKAEAAEAKQNFFNEYCRKGRTSPELKLMTVADDTTGGYLAPIETVNEMISNIQEWSPIRQIARVRQTSRKAIEIPRKTQNTTAAWGSEGGTESETQNMAFGMIEIPAHKLVARTDITDEDLQDPVYNLESELMMDWGEAFGIKESDAFVNGDGVNKPRGLLTETYTNSTTSATAATVTADELIDCFYKLKEAYARNATWIMRRATVGAIRKLKDGNDQYLWQPGLQAADPSLLLGRPIVECPDMPAVGSLAKAILLGDFRAGYMILDRMDMSVLRDPYTSAGTGTVRFFSRKRVGGRVLKTEAFSIYVCKTS